MRTILVWSLMLGLVLWALWELQATKPVILPGIFGVLLLVLGLLGGLRIATTSATRFVKDLTRLNHYLAEQNRDLADMNHLLVKKALQEELEHDI